MSLVSRASALIRNGSSAAGFETDEKQGYAAGLKALHQIGSLLGLSSQQEIGNGQIMHDSFNPSQHGSELRKKQNAPPLRDQFGQYVRQPVQLGRRDVRRVIRINELRIAACLTQLQRRLQHDDAAACQSPLLDGLAHAPMLAQSDAVVEVPLPLVEFYGLQDLDLWRQIPCDGILGSAQQKGLNSTLQSVRAPRIAGVLDGVAVVSLESLPVAEQARLHEIEQRPQFPLVCASSRMTKQNSRCSNTCEAADFLPPVAENTHRRHDQRGLVQTILLLLGGQMSQRLHRLSQSHVVGEYAAQAVAAPFANLHTNHRPRRYDREIADRC